MSASGLARTRSNPVKASKSPQSGAAQLVTNTKGNTTSIVGMSMVPSIWIVNFALIYTLNPRLAAKMPAYWAPIPPLRCREPPTRVT